MTIEKIKNNVNPNILQTIDELSKNNEKEKLQTWLTDCEKEIQFRESLKENSFPLYCEKVYLQTVLNSQF